MTAARHEQMPTGVSAALAANIAAQVPSLMTDALLLRAPEARDFEAYAEIVCSERGKYIGGPMSRAVAWWDFVQLASCWMLHGHGGWAIEDAETGDLQGFVILGLEPGDLEIELGFLIREDSEGLGVAFEAAQMARHFAFETLKLTELVSYVHKQNTRSIALAKRLGAEETEHDAETLAFIHRKETDE